MLSDHFRKRIARFLLALYLMVLTAGVLHNHDCAGEIVSCQDCLSHVQHDSHFDEGTLSDGDCVLCNFLNTSYLTAQVVLVAIPVLIAVACPDLAVMYVQGQSVCLPSLRAPPGL